MRVEDASGYLRAEQRMAHIKSAGAQLQAGFFLGAGFLVFRLVTVRFFGLGAGAAAGFGSGLGAGFAAVVVRRGLGRG